MSAGDALMIYGMIELLTARYARGWVNTGDPNMPVMVRARLRETVLAQISLETAVPALAAQSKPGELARTFRLEFPAVLIPGQLFNLSIEALGPDSEDWHPLPRHLWIKAAGDGMPAQNDRVREFQSACAAIAPSNAPFWSDGVERAPINYAEAKPVFVLGGARSGTTALCLALNQGTRYHGFSEGHVFDLATRLVNAINAHFEFKAQWMPAKAAAGYQIGLTHHSRVHTEMLEMLRRLSSGFTSPFWFDKTPTYQMIASVPTVAQAWPNARFIYMRRRGLENVCSRLRKFPKTTFPDNCKDWRIIMKGWRLAREMVPGRYLEIDQYDLAKDPETAAARVGTLLDLEPSEVKAFAEIIRFQRPEATGSAESIFGDLSELNWSTEQIETFRELCGLEMAEYGYSYDARYYC
jgi:hypothetical protein